MKNKIMNHIILIIIKIIELTAAAGPCDQCAGCVTGAGWACARDDPAWNDANKCGATPAAAATPAPAAATGGSAGSAGAWPAKLPAYAGVADCLDFCKLHDCADVGVTAAARAAAGQYIDWDVNAVGRHCL